MASCLRTLMSSNIPFCSCCPINSTEEPSVVSCLTGSWHFLREKLAFIIYFNRILQLSSFLLICSLQGMSVKLARVRFFAEGHPQRWEVTLRQLRSLVQKILLIQSMSKECCIVVKRRNLLQKERETESSNFWICITHLKKGKWKWVKARKTGSKYNSVAIVLDNLNWCLITIKLSTLFLYLTFAVRIKLHFRFPYKSYCYFLRTFRRNILSIQTSLCEEMGS